MHGRPYSERIGEKTGCLTLVGLLPIISGHRRGEFKCECGAVTAVWIDWAFRVQPSRCRMCRSRKGPSKHLAAKPEKRARWLLKKLWSSMKSRCYDKKHHSYRNYGARGITVCERWLESFDNFLTDMGQRPDGMTLDRINSNGNYEPDNCRWATMTQQARNKRTNVYVDAFGLTKLQCEWAEICGLGRNAMANKIKSKGPEMAILSTEKGREFAKSLG